MKKLHPDCPLDVHPLANLLPMIKGDAANRFKALVQEQGVHTPIVILQTGSPVGNGRIHEGAPLILAGRNRVKHGLNCGIAWDTIPKRDYDLTVDGAIEEFTDREDVGGRRHLSPDDLAIYGGKLLKIRTAAIDAEREAARLAQAELDKQSEPQPEVVTEGDSAEVGATKQAAKKKAKKTEERASHEARKDIAESLDISEDAVKKGAAVAKHEDLSAAVADGTLSLDAAYKQASDRRAADQAKKHATRIKEARMSSITYLKSTFGAESPFTKSVIKKDVFGDEGRGHKDLAIFIELSFEQQMALIPLLYDGLSMKDALNVYETAPTFDSTVLETINHAVSNGLIESKTPFALEFGDYTVTITPSKPELKRLKELSK